MKIKIATLFLLLSFSLFSQTHLPNLSSMYDPGASPLHPFYKIYNLNDSILRVYFFINLDELQFQTGVKGSFAKIRFKYILFDNFRSFSVLDSLSKGYVLKKISSQRYLVSFFDIHTSVKQAQLVIILRDVYANSSAIYFHKLERDKISADNFLLKNATENILVFNNYQVNATEKYLVENSAGLDRYFVKVYKADSLMPLPPFSQSRSGFKKFLDTAFWVNSGDSIVFSKPGIYLFLPDTNAKSGFTVVYFRDNFPYVYKASQMIPPLQYITSTKEYSELAKQKNPKLALDMFWLKIAQQDKYQAKELIRIYYNRVFYANVFFTAYKEGWQTDRGMVYIVFGPPHFVYKDDEKEVWMYNIPNQIDKLTFNFYVKSTPFSVDDYFLKRNTMYRKYWEKFVSSWKTGNLLLF